MRKTKIICTVGPATDNKDVMRDIILSGMEVARFNFSHGTHEEHLARVKLVRSVGEELGRPVALMLDTKGPEIRLGDFAEPEIELKEGQSFTLCTRELTGDKNHAYVTFAGLPGDVSRGSHILIDDGLIDMRVESVSDDEINCTVLNGGPVSAHKSINVPGVRLSMPYISGRDRSDLRFAVDNDFDFIAASFTRCADDVLQMREELERLNCHSLRIIAKIENADGVANADDILRVSDGLMVARGDMGVEIPLEDVPVVQKRLIKKAYASGKQVITATQMLDSMMHNPRPTRAECSDVANAIYDGTSAIMLSGETAAGMYPVESVKTMARIAERTERDIDYKKRFRQREGDDLGNMTNAISHATCAAAHDLSAVAIITVTKSGDTARMISKYRPDCPIIGCTPEPRVARQLNMAWGVAPLSMDEKTSTDSLFAHALDVTIKAGYVKEGDLVVITAGVPLGVPGTTNMMKIHVVGEPMIQESHDAN